MPDVPMQTRSYLGGVVRLRVCERFVASFVATRASEQSNFFRNWLFDVKAEAVLHTPLLPMCLYVRRAIMTGQESVYCFPVAAHICVIRIREQSDQAEAIAQDLVSNLELSVLATGPPQVPVKTKFIC